MGTEFAFVSYDRSEFKHDLLSFKGMAKEARIRMKDAEVKKKEKEAAKAAGHDVPDEPAEKDPHAEESN